MGGYLQFSLSVRFPVMARSYSTDFRGLLDIQCDGFVLVLLGEISEINTAHILTSLLSFKFPWDAFLNLIYEVLLRFLGKFISQGGFRH